MGDDSFMFFGTKSEYVEMEKKEEVEKTRKEKSSRNEEDDEPKKKVTHISYDLATNVDDETMRILRRTRHPHDPKIVYMQSDVSFYDTFYTSKDDDNIADKELLQEARSIRRIYKSYPDYLYAVHIRELYIDALREKIGKGYLSNIVLRSGKYWIPPVPIYSKKAADYDSGEFGMVNTSELSEWDDELLESLIEEMRKDMGINDASDIVVDHDVATDNFTLCHSDLVQTTNIGHRETSVDLADMEELQKIFRGWYQDDSAKQSKEDAANSDLMKRAFSKTPEKMKKAYYMSLVYDFSREFRNIMDDVPIERPYNPNEMVYDEIEHRPMSRKELESRKLVRLLQENGWGNTLRLMKLIGVGSSREYTMMRIKNKNKKIKKNKKSGSFQDTGVYGDKGIDRSTALSDLDSLKAQMFLD